MGGEFKGYNPEEEDQPESVLDGLGREVSATFMVEGGAKITVGFEYEGDSLQPSRAVTSDSAGKVLTVREFKYNGDGNETSVIERDEKGTLLVSHDKNYDQDGNLASDDVVYGEKPEEVCHFTYERDGENTTVRESRIKFPKDS